MKHLNFVSKLKDKAKATQKTKLNEKYKRKRITLRKTKEYNQNKRNVVENHTFM